MANNPTPLKQANQLYAAGKYSEALAAYEEIKRNFPDLSKVIDINIENLHRKQKATSYRDSKFKPLKLFFSNLTKQNLSQDCVLENGWIVSRQNRSTPGLRFDLPEEKATVNKLSFRGLEASSSKLNVFMLDNSGAVVNRAELSSSASVEEAVLTLTRAKSAKTLFVTFKNPDVGDRFRFEELVVEFVQPATHAPAIIGIRPKVAAGVASIPQREQSLAEVISVIAQQTDEIHVFLNKYEKVPSWLVGKPEVHVYTSQEFDDQGDIGKFFGLRNAKADFCLTIDDDILYPDDYTKRLVKAAQIYGSPVGVHGSLLRFPATGYYTPSSRSVFHFGAENPFDRRVHILGTGTLCFDKKILQESLVFPYRNMADIWFAKYCAQNEIAQICVARDSNWLQPIGSDDDSIYKKNHLARSTQNIIVDREVTLSAPLFSKAKSKLPKISVGIKTFNRLPYLKECIESLVRTVDAEFETVIIVADDGSNDGTVEYLENLRIPFEFHVIRNKRAYVSGQANSIFERAMEINSDFIIMLDDDLYFKRTGWMKAYYETAINSGYHHLCHFNLPHYEQLCERRGEDFPPAARFHSEHPLVAHTGVENCMGALFTLTPDVVKKVGWADEVNFFVRGLWHVDYSTRCCRAGFNEAQRFFDIKDANDYLELQNTRTESYTTSIAWESPEFKKAAAPDERARRRELIADSSRIFISRSDAKFGRLIDRKKIHTKKHTVNQFFDKVFVINLDRRPDRLQTISAKLSQLGIDFERFPAVDGTAADLQKEYSEYRKARELAPRGKKLTSRQFNLERRPDIERVESLEFSLNSAAIRTAGAWAYSKTYERILRRCLTEGMTRVLVLDDDACFHKDFHHLFDRAVAELPSDWKLFQLGTMQYDWDQTRPYSDHLYLPDGVIVASHAVGFHADAIPVMLDSIDRWSLPFDIGPLYYACREFKEKSFVALPNLIIQDQSESDIASSDVAHTESQKASNIYRWNIQDYN